MAYRKDGATTSVSVSYGKSDVVNDVVVLDYSSGEYAKYLKEKEEYKRAQLQYEEGIEDGEEAEEPTPPVLKNALEGLSILDVTVSEQSNLTRSPIETGVQISDSKVRMPRKITIKGMCNNLRGEIEFDKKKLAQRDGVIGGKMAEISYGIADAVWGFDFNVKQKIETRARSVYKKIHEMYVNKERVNGKPRTWTVSTKGAVYENMILQAVDQLNDWEHPMLIPVTLHFEELMMVGEDATDGVYKSEDDSPLQVYGSMKKGTLFEEPMAYLESTASFLI